jgi:hypothetical protein
MPWKLRKKREAHEVVDDLKLKLLERVIELDPEPEDLERVLFEAALEEPLDGPARGVVTDILLDWEMVRTSPRTALWMVEEAVAPIEPRRRRRSEP